jgi:hypothetical protein
VAAALAMVLMSFALTGGPQWFARDQDGFSDPLLDESILGFFTLLLVPLQVLLIVFAARGFSQRWSVEVERDGGRHGAAHGLVMRRSSLRPDEFVHPGD